jgi:hypothetical protein
MSQATQAGVTIRPLIGEECAALGLRGPLVIEIDCDGVGFVAKVLAPQGIEAFGSGPSMPAAVADLVEVMREEASSLLSRQRQLAPSLAHELEILNQVLVAEGTVPQVRPAVYIGVQTTVGATGPEYRTELARNSYLPYQAAVELSV